MDSYVCAVQCCHDNLIRQVSEMLQSINQLMTLIIGTLTKASTNNNQLQTRKAEYDLSVMCHANLIAA